MDLLFRRHHANDDEPGTPPPRGYDYAPREIRDATPASDAGNEPEPESDATVETPLATDSADDDDDQPKSSARAAKRGAKTTSMSKTTSGTKTASETRRKRHRGGLDGADDSEPDSDEIPVGHPFADPVLSPQAMLHHPNKKYSAPPPPARALRSGGRLLEPARNSAPQKKASPPTTINSSSKRDRAAMMDDEDPQHPAENCRLPKKIVRRNGASSTYPNAEPGVGSPEVQNPFQEPSFLVSPLQSTSSPEVSADDLKLRRSAEQLLMVASGAQRGGSTRVE